MRRDVNTLCREILLDGFNPEVIVGLSRGGLTPGVMMSHWMQKPFKPVKASLRDFPEWEDYLPKKTDERVLIVDDICDSGETFDRIKSYIKGPRINQPMELPVEVRFATLWWNNECNVEPHYYVNQIAKDSTGTWIHFPWESWWNTPI
tara:strand:- start:364 stop:807 length:444 start_codon:yes stop_codon:yes gene_type:complete